MSLISFPAYAITSQVKDKSGKANDGSIYWWEEDGKAYYITDGTVYRINYTPPVFEDYFKGKLIAYTDFKGNVYVIIYH